MGKPAVLAIKVVADAQQAQAELGKTGDKVSKTSKVMGKLALPAGIALGAITAFGKTAVSAASDVEQSMGGLEAVFGSSADAAKDLAKNAAKTVGLATGDYATLAAQLGAQLKGMGTAQKDLVPTTDKLVKLGADLAATYGGTTADAVSAVSSLLRGERDPIERYGVSLNQAAVNAALAAKGLTGLTGAAATQAQAQVTLELLTKQTSAAQGQFAAQTNTTAEQQQIANAEFKNAQAALGKALLPAVTMVTKGFGSLAEMAGKNTKVVSILVGVIAALAAGVLAYNAVMKVVTVATKLWSVAQAALNLVMSLNPIALVVIAVAALVAGLIIAYKKSETFRDIVNGAFNAVLAVVKSVASWIQKFLGPIMAVGFDAAAAQAKILLSVVQTVMEGIKAAVNAVKSVIGTIADAIQKVLDLIGKIHIPKLPNLNPFSHAAPPGVAAANTAGLTSTRRTAVSRGAASAGGVSITVTGALDPDAVARQIEALLRRRQVRIGTASGLGPGWARTVPAAGR